MKTVPIAGTLKSVSFFEDDTIETVRQLIALAVGSHPDRLFLEVKGSFPKETYATSPKAWTDLFLRMSYDGKRILRDTLKTYLEQKRIGTSVVAVDVSKEDWESHAETLQPLFNPSKDFEEWRILGVPEVQSFVLPLPPRDLRELPATRIPIAQGQSLFETLHPYDISEIRVTELPSAPSELVKRVYFPNLRPDTPVNLESFRSTLEGNQTQLQKLLDLDTPKHQSASIVRAKWFIPLQSTQFPAPRTRFEQIFYGMTVTESLPYIGYFTAKTETMRHKFYVTDPKTKKPLLDTSMWKGWFNNTQPQRRRPTLLLYRGKARNVFDRIAITDKEITVDVRREKDSTATLDELREEILEWMKEFDALLPFLVKSDIDESRWELADLAVVASYSKEIREFDMHRFSCLQTLFGMQDDTFRLLRAEHSSEDISPQEIQAFQILNQEDSERTPAYLAKEMNLTDSQALDLFQRVTSLSEDLNLERSLRAYPTLKFSNKEVILKFVTNLERTLKYADILRFVLTSDSEAVDAVCPRRMEKVPPKATVPQQEIQIEGEFSADDDFNALLGFGGEETPAETPAEEPVTAGPKEKKVKVTARTQGTYNYFNNRLQKFDPATFDDSFYPSKCDKKKQVVVLTPEDKARMGSEYDYSGASEGETLELTDPNATAICPPYWCMRDEIPLREDQLVEGDDGEMHCPVCDGKVRTSDNVDALEFPVIQRDGDHKYPNFMKKHSTINNRKVPCCYKEPRSGSEIIAPSKEDVTYILDSSNPNVPGLRLAYLSPEVASHLRVKTSYETTVRKGRLTARETDVFRVGLGRPSKTLPVILGDKTVIKRPRDAEENVKRCSFYRTWRETKEGDILASIDDAYEQGRLSLLEELEYVTSFLKCEVILVDVASLQVTCGFWSDTLGASSRSIAILGSTILASVTRKKEGNISKPLYTADLRKAPFTETTLPLLRDLHTKACAVNLPGMDDAIQELQAKGQKRYQVILDPMGRIQALYVPTKVVLPIQPANIKPDEGVPVKDGYKDIPDTDLPTETQQRAFVRASRHPGFRIVGEHTNVAGGMVELMMASGFRLPVQVAAPKEEDVPREVIETIRRDGEEPLVDGDINEEDKKTASDILYTSEIREFLLFSLSKDIQTEDESDLRRAIETRDPNLYIRIKAWFKENAYSDSTESPVEFVNKVRTPCGQYSDKQACSNSSLCGWHKKVCKIRVKPVVDTKLVLKDLARLLLRNDKQRALVLDGRLSPFFSTVLYLEMPHEWITTSV